MVLWLITSEAEPSTPSTGLAWRKPSTGQTYEYINSGWRVIAGGNSFTFTIPVTILFNGSDRTPDIQPGSIKIKDVLTNIANTCSFKFDSDSDYKPQEGEQVTIWKKTTAAEVPTKIFTGEVAVINDAEHTPGVNKFWYQITCGHADRNLRRELVVESYEDQTDQAIIQDIIDKYATGFSYNNVASLQTISSISFNYKYPFECIKEIAKETGADWYVDEDLDVHYFDEETNLAPYELTEDPDTSGHFQNLKIKVDKTQYRNVCYVQGGDTYSNDYPQIATIVADQDSVQIDYEPFKAASGAIEMYIDAGGGYGAKITPGIDNIDNDTDDYVINRAEKLLRDVNTNWAAGHKIKLIFKYAIPILVKVREKTSIETIQEIEGGTGIYEMPPIIDKTITEEDAASARGRAELSGYTSALVTGSFNTNQHGYRSGQLLTVNLPGRGYASKQYLIREVEINPRTGNLIEYKIKFSIRQKFFTEFLTEMFDRGKEVIIRAGETLHEYEDVAEVIPITESDYSKIEVTPPYKIGPGGSPQAVINISEMG